MQSAVEAGNVSVEKAQMAFSLHVREMNHK